MFFQGHNCLSNGKKEDFFKKRKKWGPALDLENNNACEMFSYLSSDGYLKKGKKCNATNATLHALKTSGC